MFYREASHWDNARWYDPALGRFAQADSIIPGGPQGLDRYAYVNNSPVNFTDPTGHISCAYYSGQCQTEEEIAKDRTESLKKILESYNVTVDDKFNDDEIGTIVHAVVSIGHRIAETINTGELGSDAFKKVFKPITFTKSDKDYKGCVFQTEQSVSCSKFTYDEYQSGVNNVVHELGHVLNQLIGGAPNDFGLKYAPLRNYILRPDEGIDWQQHPTPPDPSGGEMFGDMFVAWAFDAWNTHPLNVDYVNSAKSDMDTYMRNWLNK